MDLVEAVKTGAQCRSRECVGEAYNLGDIYQYDMGVAKDEVKAAELYRLAAAQGVVNPAAAKAAMEGERLGLREQAMAVAQRQLKIFFWAPKLDP